MYIFVYGSLMRGFGNNRLLANASFIGEATTRAPFKMRYAGFPYIRAVKHDGLPVRGEVWRIDSHVDGAAILEALDRLEGVDNGHYERRVYEVMIDGRDAPVKAQVYEATVETWEHSAGLPEVRGNKVCDWRIYQTLVDMQQGK